MLEHYKSWAGLKKQLNGLLCEALERRISYFLTRYHDVHNSYGRASIRFDDKELVCFSWIEMYHQESATYVALEKDTDLSYEDSQKQLKPEWDRNCTYCEMDFMDSVLKFRSMPIKAALGSDDYITKILAILDKRVGNKTLEQLSYNKEYKAYPEWVQQFYKIRFASSKIAF